MKDNFLLKRNQKEVFDELTNEEAGKLIKGIFNYVATGESNLKGSLKAIFIPIKNDIDRNEEKYQRIIERNRENGKNGGRPKKNEDLEETQKTQSDILETQGNPKKPDACHISYITNHISSNLGKDKGVIGEEEKPFKAIVEHLNKRTGSNYKHTTESTRQKINARLNEGYNLDDFIVVIDKKCVEWMNTDMQKYLRPETLFGTKFESYLNAPVSKKEDLRDLVSDDFMEVFR